MKARREAIDAGGAALKGKGTAIPGPAQYPRYRSP